MKKPNQTELLNQNIIALKQKQTQDLIVLKNQFQETYESFNPINLIKSTFKSATTSPDLKNNIVENVIGLATGYLSKKIILGATHNPITKILGTVLQFVVTNVVAKQVQKSSHKIIDITPEKE